MDLTDAVMFEGPRDLPRVPKHVPSLSPGDDMAALRVSLGLDFSREKSLFRTELAAYTLCGPYFFLQSCARAGCSTMRALKSLVPELMLGGTPGL